MSRPTRAELDARVAAAWPVADVAEARGHAALLADIDDRVAAGDRPAVHAGRQLRRPPRRRVATALVAAVLVAAVLLVGGLVAQRQTSVQPDVISPVDDAPREGAGPTVDDPRATLDAAVARTRDPLRTAGVRWSTELWRTSGPADVTVVTRERLGPAHLARYRTADRDGDWSQEPVEDIGSAPLALRSVDGRQFARIDGDDGWTEIRALDGLEGPSRLLDRDAFLDAVAALRSLRSVPAGDGLIRLVTDVRGREGALAVALGMLPAQGGANAQPRVVQADVRIDPASGTIRQVGLWQRMIPGRGSDTTDHVVQRTVVTLRYDTDVPDVVAPGPVDVASWEQFCTTGRRDAARCVNAVYARPNIGLLDDVEPVDP